MSEDSIALVKFSLSYKPNHPTIHLESSENISVPLRLPPPLHLFYHIGYLIVSANLKFFIVMNICNIQISFMNSLIYRELRLFHYMRFITGFIESTNSFVIKTVPFFFTTLINPYPPTRCQPSLSYCRPVSVPLRSALSKATVSTCVVCPN